jgi:hypothetical protein
MAKVALIDQMLRLELSPLDMIAAIHGSFAIPIDTVLGASTTKPPGFFSSVKVLGTNAPGLKMAGSFFYHGESVFFDFRGNEDAVLVIDLARGGYRHLFVHVDFPDTAMAAAERINAALKSRR